jgi:hypothetical protein
MSDDGIGHAISTFVEAIANSGRWQLFLIILGYTLIVYFTNRLLITSPLRLQLMERIAEERAELRALNATKTSGGDQSGNGSSTGKPAQFDTEQCDTAATPAVMGICELLKDAERRVSFQIRLPGMKGKAKYNHPFITLAKVRAGWRYVHAAERLRVQQSKEAERRAFAVIACERLFKLGSDEATFLSNTIQERVRKIEEEHRSHVAQHRAFSSQAGSTSGQAHNATPARAGSTRAADPSRGAAESAVAVKANGLDDQPDSDLQHMARDAELAVLLGEGLRLSYDHADVELEQAAEAQRRAMWLTCVGLALALIVGLYGMREALLLGAVGGFLAPLTLVWQHEDEGKVNEYATSWGLLLLGPVAGALAAYGGLLLLRFLADENINVLGEVFRNNSWDQPTTTLALALALLFGFSGRLFGRLALTATPQVLPPTPGGGPAGATTTPGRGATKQEKPRDQDEDSAQNTPGDG